MVTTRVTTFSYHQRLMTDYSRSQIALTDIQRQTSSGKIARTFEDLNGKVEIVNALENKLKNIDQNMDSNNQIVSHMETTVRAVDDVVKITDDVIKLLVLARSATQAQYPVFAEQLKGKLNNIAGLLNTNISGRYLFAGSKTDTRPVIEPVPDSLIPGVGDDSYYRGNNEKLTARVSENFLMEYGVKANDPGFQNLIAGINLAIKTMQSGGTGSSFDASFTLLNKASDEVNAISAHINANIVMMRETNEFLDSTKAYIFGLYGTETSTDLVTASTEAAVHQGILQASFSIFAKVSSLKLSDYLR